MAFAGLTPTTVATAPWLAIDDVAWPTSTPTRSPQPDSRYPPRPEPGAGWCTVGQHGYGLAHRLANGGWWEVSMDPTVLATTRRSLHAVAELVLAGPQYHRSGTIRLRTSPGGFATVTAPEVRVDGTHLVVDDRPVPIDGHTCAQLAAAAGWPPQPLREVYHDAVDVAPDELLSVDPTAAGWLARCWSAGQQALRALVPTQTPVLWPEHFDIAVRAEDTNFGVSPGDSHIAEPYAYVGPPTPQRGGFWNQPFGAARLMHDLNDADPDTVLAFFRDARQRVTADT